MQFGIDKFRIDKFRIDKFDVELTKWNWVEVEWQNGIDWYIPTDIYFFPFLLIMGLFVHQ